MNPTINSDQPNVSLSAPISGQPSLPLAANPAPAPNPTTAQTVMGAPPPVAPQLAAIPAQPATISQPASRLDSKSVVPDTADDGDLIEKEWVERVKRIVRDTMEDPYEQSKQLTELKVEYMKKRYNKNIRQDE